MSDKTQGGAACEYEGKDFGANYTDLQTIHYPSGGLPFQTTE